MKFLKRIYSSLRAILMIPAKINALSTEINELKASNHSLIELNQKIIFATFKNSQNISLDDSGFRIHSQFEEDGLLLYVFSKIGFKTRKGLEICCGNGKECMISNLIQYHGFDALLFDGDPEHIKFAKQYFSDHPNTYLNPPKIVNAWITKDNINELVKNNGLEGDIDIFSLDIDGMDYYVMKELNVVNPRVVICETMNNIPKDLSVTIPYKEDFYYLSGEFHPEFRSVSVLGMVKLMRSKNYRLIAHNRYGFNLIFLRNDVGQDIFKEINHEDCFNNSYTTLRQKDWQQVSELNWVNV